MQVIFGIDLGGTKTEGVVLTKERLEPVARIRIPTESHKGYQHILNRIHTLTRRLQDESGFQPHHIGLGTPGTLDPQTNTIKNSNTVCLNGKPLKTDLEKVLHCKLTIANDANCFALAETKLGIIPKVLPDAQTVFGIIMGTGVGGGIVINGKVLYGKHGIAGEWGHNFLDKSGGACYCGRIGCVETILSGKGLEKYYTSLTNNQLELPEIVNRAKFHGDDAAKSTLDRLYYFFGKTVAQVINIIDPDAIIVGGGVGNINELYTNGKASINNFIFNDLCHTPILKPLLGDSAGVFGAALLTK